MMSKLQTFISKAVEIHDVKYDYSLVDYVNASTKVDIICKKHINKFSSTPSNHLRGTGCPLCGRERTSSARRYSHQDFIDKLNIIHNGELNFSILSEYKTDKSIILIGDEYGQYKMKGRSLLLGYRPTILSATDKTKNTIKRFQKKAWN